MFHFDLAQVCLTRVHLESLSGAAGGYPLTELTVDGIALEAGIASARLLRHWVLRPRHKTLPLGVRGGRFQCRGRSKSFDRNDIVWCI